MSTALPNQQPPVSPERMDEVRLKIKKWMLTNKSHYSDCTAILWEMTGANSYFAEDQIGEMRSFFVNLLAFFCNPENARKFNALSGLYEAKDWPVYLSRLVYAFQLLENPGARGEMHVYEMKHFGNLQAHQPDYIEQLYEAA